MSNFFESVTDKLGLSKDTVTEQAENLLNQHRDQIPDAIEGKLEEAIHGGMLGDILEKVGIGGHSQEATASEETEEVADESDEEATEESDEEEETDDEESDESSEDETDDEASDDEEASDDDEDSEEESDEEESSEEESEEQ